MANRKYRIAWENDDDTLSEVVYNEEDRWFVHGQTWAKMFGGLTVPSFWLRPVERELPEPGHVWFRVHHDSDWEPGLLSLGKTTLINNRGTYRNPNRTYKILPAHTTPLDADEWIPADGRTIPNGPGKCPVCGSAMYWRSSEMTVGSDGIAQGTHRAVPMCPMCGTWPGDGRQSANHPTAQPTYARRWEELSWEEQYAVIKWASFTPMGDTREYAKSMYEDIVQSVLFTLRSASEFTDDELDDLANVYLHGEAGRHAKTRALVDKAFEIAKRSTS